MSALHKYTKKELMTLITGKLRRNFGRDVEEATSLHMFKACALVLRDIMSERQMKTADRVAVEHLRQVHYLSLEFLMGRSLMKNAYNLGVAEPLKQAIEGLGFSAPDLFEAEPDAGLGNGGLGRLAACFMDGLATQGYPAMGYSLRYEYGLFRQKLVDGWQTELPDNWLGLGDAWLIPKMDETEEVRFGGKVEDEWDALGRHRVKHTGYDVVLAVPKDMEIAGYGTEHGNLLRLWDANSPTPVDMNLFSSGQYLKAVEQRAMAESISKVLYPEDNHYEGKSLRLKQQYFFVSATIQSIVRKHRAEYGTLRNFHLKHVIQINDTHPTLAIPELMRILLDEEGYGWDEAWYIVTHTIAYTNHTVLAEALERWPQQLIEKWLPRIWQILIEISNRYQRALTDYFHGDLSKVAPMAIIWGGEVRMANLCVCACFKINGVSALHSDILKRDVFHDAYARTPDKFTNVTNGIDHRRWLSECNPELDALIRDCCGKDKYLLQPDALKELEQYRDDAGVLSRLGQIKADNKKAFAAWVARESGVILNTDALFDVQVKRLHEYKRQQMNALYVIYKYMEIKAGKKPQIPITMIFGAKAAPAYTIAKDIIHLILCLQELVDHDPDVAPYLKVVMVENYNVTMAEHLIPACDISEQISLASKEASGTGNMKFMLNGAVTLGTEDGANVEIHELVGDDNIYIFGESSQQVIDHYANRDYRAVDYYINDEQIRSLINFIISPEMMKIGDPYHLLQIHAELIQKDWFMTLLDLKDYIATKNRAYEEYADRKAWSKKMLTNIAMAGYFSSDRTIAEYNKDIWHLK